MEIGIFRDKEKPERLELFDRFLDGAVAMKNSRLTFVTSSLLSLFSRVSTKIMTIDVCDIGTEHVHNKSSSFNERIQAGIQKKRTIRKQGFASSLRLSASLAFALFSP